VRRCLLSEGNGLFRRNRTIERTFLTLEKVLEVVDAFAGQPSEADRQDHPMGAAGNPGRRKIALGVAERHPGSLRCNKKLGGRFIVLQAGGDLPVEDIEFGVGLFVRVAVAFV
jgi:hypothetical protein